ncbi:glycoside hydrolase family 71 protein [Mycena rosella]|uniref:Glycoside hydrolase family 71 protein n=1 Tax=Mycena rosella TaxID=1033263 RepID=A0AAD7DMN3_MYCRO|nr:glycoside hydrolase family 71 protein [Mycena rosella]
MNRLALYLAFLLRFLLASGFPGDAQTPFGLEATVSQKFVIAHFIVGNTYPYTINDWNQDIVLAASKGIDAFALNVGRDPWQPFRVADAYAAAKSLGSSFKLFLSFDMSSLPCASLGDATTLRNFMEPYQNHPNQFMYNGKPFVSTFAGESCRFGAGSLNDGWNNALKSGQPAIYFVPSFFVDPATFPSMPVMDGAFQWNSAWPMGNYDINFSPDSSYLSKLGKRSYMAGVSPWFFTHYGPDTYNKNWIYRGDNWLFAQRWELLIQNRNSIALAQIITWNDYGESHYIGPIHGAQPNSQSWVTGFDHQGWLDLLVYYIVAFKTGQYPAISRDRIFLWGRLYPAQATVSSDRVGRPLNWQWTQDSVWAIVLLKAPGQFTVSCGSSKKSVALSAGLSKLQLPLLSTCTVTASIFRNNISVVAFNPSGFQFRADPPTYNFNAFVASSP